jgi:hypothetical protein
MDRGKVSKGETRLRCASAPQLNSQNSDSANIFWRRQRILGIGLRGTGLKVLGMRQTGITIGFKFTDDGGVLNKIWCEKAKWFSQASLGEFGRV